MFACVHEGMCENAMTPVPMLMHRLVLLLINAAWHWRGGGLGVSWEGGKWGDGGWV